MKKIAALKKELAKLREKFEKLRQSHLHDPEVVKTKKAYDKALTKARNKMDEKSAPLAMKMSKLRDSIRVAEEAKRAAVPAHIAKLLVDFRKGVDYGPVEFKVLWVSSGSRFFIMTWPGHTFWSSIIEPTKYAASRHFLMDCEKVESDCGNRMFDEAQVFEAEGRLLKATKEEWKEYAKKKEV
jgi:hypothetical protein